MKKLGPLLITSHQDNCNQMNLADLWQHGHLR